MKKNTTKLYGIVALAALLPSVAFSQTNVPAPGVVVDGYADVAGDATVGGDITAGGGIIDGNGFSITNVQHQVWQLHKDDLYILSLVDQNTAAIADVADGIEGLITINEDGEVHIGPDSLVTQLDDGVQQIWAEEGGEVIDINIATNTNVNGTFTVQAEDLEPTVETALADDPISPQLANDVVDDGIIQVYSQVGTGSEETVSFGNSGIIGETNGNLTLNAAGGETVTVDYYTATRLDVYDNTDGIIAGTHGEAVDPAGTKVGGYYLDNDGDGEYDEFVELGVLNVDGELELDEAMIADLEAQGLVMREETVNGGGNLQVGGDANVDGVLSVGEVADVEMAIGDNAAAIAQVEVDLALEEAAREAADSAEEAARMAADDALAADIEAEAVAREAADDALASDLADEVARAMGEEGALWSAIGDEAAVRQAGDDAITAGYQADDAAIVAAHEADVAALAAADQVLSDGLTAEAAAREAGDADLQAQIDNEVANRVAGDSALQSNIDAEAAARASADSALSSALNSHVSQIWDEIEMISDQVEKNTRGIAMVAAMTSPTVREGMENALDFHLAHFDGETGAAISYARRVNENVQLNIAAASTTDFDDSVVRGGVSLQW
jgi:hypothetical protein